MIIPLSKAKRTKEAAKIAVLISPIPHDGLRKWLKKHIEHATLNDNGQRGLFIYVSRGVTMPGIRHISQEKRLELSLSLMQTLMVFEDNRYHATGVNLEPLLERCSPKLDVLSFVDCSAEDFDAFESSTAIRQTIKYLETLIIPQLSEQYDYIVVDLSEFQNPSIYYPIMAISNHVILPYVLNHEDMMRGLYTFNQAFMEIRVSGLPLLIGGIIPMFSNHDIEKQKIELRKIRRLFGVQRVWSSVFDQNDQHNLPDAEYVQIDNSFFETIRKGSYGIGGAQEDALKWFNVIALPRKHLGKAFIEAVAELKPRDQLIKILDYFEMINSTQKNVIMKLEEGLAGKIALRFISDKDSVIPNLILAILEVSDPFFRNEYLNSIANSKHLEIKEVAAILGLSNAYNCLEEISLTKHWDLAYCEKLTGIKVMQNVA